MIFDSIKIIQIASTTFFTLWRYSILLIQNDFWRLFFLLTFSSLLILSLSLYLMRRLLFNFLLCRCARFSNFIFWRSAWRALRFFNNLFAKLLGQTLKYFLNVDIVLSARFKEIRFYCGCQSSAFLFLNSSLFLQVAFSCCNGDYHVLASKSANVLKPVRKVFERTAIINCVSLIEGGITRRTA